ncbi:MAG TPA: hypothetical protein V6C76_10255 [Drouetiella sp.]
MAVSTTARVAAVLGVTQTQPRSLNRSNIGFDRGMMKGYNDNLVHLDRKRLTTKGTTSGKKRPYFFLKPLKEVEAPTIRPNRPQNVSRLRKLEKRSLWWTGLIANCLLTFRALQKFSLNARGVTNSVLLFVRSRGKK